MTLVIAASGGADISVGAVSALGGAVCVYADETIEAKGFRKLIMGIDGKPEIIDVSLPWIWSWWFFRI